MSCVCKTGDEEAEVSDRGTIPNAGCEAFDNAVHSGTCVSHPYADNCVEWGCNSHDPYAV